MTKTNTTGCHTWMPKSNFFSKLIAVPYFWPRPNVDYVRCSATLDAQMHLYNIGGQSRLVETSAPESNAPCLWSDHHFPPFLLLIITIEMLTSHQRCPIDYLNREIRHHKDEIPCCAITRQCYVDIFRPTRLDPHIPPLPLLNSYRFTSCHMCEFHTPLLSPH